MCLAVYLTMIVYQSYHSSSNTLVKECDALGKKKDYLEPQRSSTLIYFNEHAFEISQQRVSFCAFQ